MTDPIRALLRHVTLGGDFLTVSPVENDETGEVGYEAYVNMPLDSGDPVGYSVTAEGALEDLAGQISAGAAREGPSE